MLANQSFMGNCKRMKRLLFASMLFLAVFGCTTRPQKGGGGSVSPQVTKSLKSEINAPSEPSLGMPVATFTQPENPNSPSSQGVDYEYNEEVITPYDTVRETTTSYPDGRSVTVKEPIPAGTRTLKKAKSVVVQEVGGTWKDTARELAAALGSFQVVQYVGIALLLAGAVCFFHPVLRGIVGGKDTAMAIGGCGAVMIFGPYLFVKYSNYFFLAILGVGAYWVIARLKYKEGKLDHIETLPAANATKIP